MSTPSSVRWLGDSQFRTLHQGPEYDLTEALQTPGTQTPLHRHSRYVENVQVVAGSVEVWIEDQHLTLEAGGSVTIPIGAAHTVRAGAGGAHALVVSRPARFAGLMARVTTDGPAPPDLENFAREAAAIGDELLGAPGALPEAGR